MPVVRCGLPAPVRPRAGHVRSDGRRYAAIASEVLDRAAIGGASQRERCGSSPGPIHPKYSTPTYGILSIGAVTLVGGFLLSFQVAAEAINFGALLGFMGVNLSVISHYPVIPCDEWTPAQVKVFRLMVNRSVT